MIIFLAILSILWGIVFCNVVPLLNGRIVGGVETTIQEFPYQVSVCIYNRHICGGSILNTNTILTAAHCVDGMDHSQYSVRVGATRHMDGQRYNVSHIVKHEQYHRPTGNHDMAILKLDSPLTQSSGVQPISLQPNGGEVSPGTTAWVSGWGYISEAERSTRDVLRKVDVAVISNNVCNDKYGAGRISANMMCAQTLEHDACQGDSGGPLVANGRLVGVVSWGYGCARPQYPGVYSKVSNMHKWIAGFLN